MHLRFFVWSRPIEIAPSKRKFKCEMCERVFSNRSGVRQHMICLHGVAPTRLNPNHRSYTGRVSKTGKHECSMCEQRFAIKRNLLLHLVSVHSLGVDEARDALKKKTSTDAVKIEVTVASEQD